MEDRELFGLCESQRFLVLGETLTERSDIINMVGFHAYFQNCDFSLLEKSWNRVLEINDGLRIRITGYAPSRKQYFVPYEYEKIPIVSVNGKEGFQKLENEERNRAVRLRKGALYRVTFVDCGNGYGGMIACIHDICCDGYSMELMFKQLESFYLALQEGKPLPEMKKLYSYRDFLLQDIEYTKSDAFSSDRDFWRKKYRDQKHYSIPCGHSSNSVETGVVKSEFSGPDYERFCSFCNKTGCTPNSALMSLMALSTYFLTKKKCFCFYSLSHGRRTFSQKQTVGCIVGMNPAFFNIDTGHTFRDMVERDYVNYLEEMKHGRFPFFRHFLLSYFQSLKLGLNFIHFWMFFSPMQFGSLSSQSKLGLEVFDESHMINPFYTSVFDIQEDHTLRVEMNYQLKKYKQASVDRMKYVFEKTFAWCLAHPESSLKELEAILLPGKKRKS